MVRLTFAGLGCGLVLFCRLWLSVASGASGVVEGRVTNGTFPDQAALVKEVTLYRIEENQSPEKVGSQEPRDGRYRFEGLEVGPQIRYRLSTSYQGVPYFSEEVVFAHGQTPEITRTVDLKVYELTEDAGPIHLSRDHLILEISGQEITVTEFLLLNNAGNRTVWKERLLRLSLPDGYRDFRGPGEPIRTGGDGGFWLAEPVLPGANQVLFTYRLDFSGAGQELRKKIDYRTDHLDLLIADKGLEVESPDLSFQGAVDMNGQRFLRWAVDGLHSGTAVHLRLSASTASRYAYQGGAIAIVLLLIGAGFAYPLAKTWSARKTARLALDQASEPKKDHWNALRREKKKLIAAIAELDDRYEAGQLKEEEYRKARASNLRRAAEIARQLKDQS